MQDKTLFSSLAYAGTLPFLACALLPFVGVASIRPFGSLDQLAASYGLAIICFLAGIHWATYLYRQELLPFNLTAGSNILFLIAWFAFAIGNLSASLVIQITLLLTLLLIDWRLQEVGIISGVYLRTRCIATGVAATALTLILIRGAL